MLRDAPGGSDVSSFSMGFDDGSYNELPYAREVAALCGTKHLEGTVTPDVAALFDRLVVHLDEPFADVSLFPTFLVSQMAREHVKVVLTGDGGDELFGGYDAYEAQALAARWAGLVPDARGARRRSRARDGAADREEEGPGQQGAAIRRRPGAGAGVDRAVPLDDVPRRRRRRRGSIRRRSATRSSASDVYAPVRDALGAQRPDDLLNRQLYADLSIYLADDILVKVDRMSMATSLETRAPFLDADVMELAFSMPGRLEDPQRRAASSS